MGQSKLLQLTYFTIILLFVLALPHDAIHEENIETHKLYIGPTGGYLYSKNRLGGVTLSAFQGYSYGITASYRVTKRLSVIGQLSYEKKGYNWELPLELFGFPEGSGMVDLRTKRSTLNLAFLLPVNLYYNSEVEICVYPGLSADYTLSVKYSWTEPTERPVEYYIKDSYRSIALNNIIGAAINYYRRNLKVRFIDICYVHGFTNLRSDDSYEEYNRGWLISTGIMIGL